MAITRSATARYDGTGKEGKGHLTTQSGVLSEQAYGFNTRFGDERGTNPEELIAAAHASCFTMATSFALAAAGYNDGTLDTNCIVTLEKEESGFTVTKSELILTANIPRIAESEFKEIAGTAKVNCPISKLLNCEISLELRLLN